MHQNLILLLIGYFITERTVRICRISRPGVQGLLQGENIVLNEKLTLKSATQNSRVCKLRAKSLTPASVQ
jgi:hypothetical protein